MVDQNEVKDLTTEEYDETYAEGEPHMIPQDVLDAAVAEAKKAEGEQ